MVERETFVPPELAKVLNDIYRDAEDLVRGYEIVLRYPEKDRFLWKGQWNRFFGELLYVWEFPANELYEASDELLEEGSELHNQVMEIFEYCCGYPLSPEKRSLKQRLAARLHKADVLLGLDGYSGLVNLQETIEQHIEKARNNHFGLSPASKKANGWSYALSLRREYPGQ